MSAAGVHLRADVEVAASTDPLVVLLGEDRSDETDQGGADPGDVGAAPNLLGESVAGWWTGSVAGPARGTG